MFNEVIIAGRLAKNPEIIKKDGRNSRTRLVVACNRPFKSKETNDYKTDFFSITLWEGTSDIVKNMLSKGSIVIVKGRLENNSYFDKDSTKKIYATNIIGERVVFMGGSLRKDEEENDESEDDGTTIESIGKILPNLVPEEDNI